MSMGANVSCEIINSSDIKKSSNTKAVLWSEGRQVRGGLLVGCEVYVSQFQVTLPTEPHSCE